MWGKREPLKGGDAKRKGPPKGGNDLLQWLW